MAITWFRRGRREHFRCRASWRCPASGLGALSVHLFPALFGTQLAARHRTAGGDEMKPASGGPLITILVPTYARARYVGIAVRNALAQTYENIEILVLDGASPDGTAAAMEEFHAESRVRYVRHAKTLGISGNWRHGIAAATFPRGTFFCLLHDDRYAGT